MAEKKKNNIQVDLEGNPTTGITPLKEESFNIDKNELEQENNQKLKTNNQNIDKEVNFQTSTENKSKKATTEAPVIDRGISDEGIQDLELTEENFKNIFLKNKEDRTEEDERFLKNIQFERSKGKTYEQIFGIEDDKTNLLSELQAEDLGKRLASGQDNALENLGLSQISFLDNDRVSDFFKSQGFNDLQVQQIINRRDAEKEISKRKDITSERISQREALALEELERKKKNIIEQSERLQNQTQRLRSLRGVGRSTETENEILELEKKGQELINAAQRNADLKIQKIRLQEEGAESEEIQAINEAISSSEKILQDKLNSNIASQKQIDAQIGNDFDTSINNMLGILEAGGVDVGEFDKDATEALGYISDSKGNPLKLDENGKPVAPKNEFGQDVKISQFKDGNDNTYVYKNGQLDSVITNEGNILKGTQLENFTVPAQVKEDKKIEQQRDLETQLRKEFISRPEVKRFQEIKAQFERVKQGANAGTAAGDLALIFSFMKMLDPASVVREGEFATAQNAAGVPDQVRNLYNKVQTGERLNSNQREEFKTTAENLFIAEQETLDGIKNSFRGIIQDSGAREEFVILGEEEFTGGDLIQNDDISEIDSIFGDGQSNSSGSGQSFNVGGKTFKIDLQGLDSPDQTGSKKVKNILGNVNATVLPKGADNPVLGKSGGSLTFRTNNPLAITATSPNQLERIVNRFGARTDIFSPDSADNLVLNFNTWEEGLEAGKKLLEGKGNMNLSQLSESHTGTSAQGHKARIQQKGLDLNRKYKDLSDDEKLLVVQAFTEAEGFTQGNDI